MRSSQKSERISLFAIAIEQQLRPCISTAKMTGSSIQECLKGSLCEQPVLFGDRKGVLDSERSDAASEIRHPMFTGKA